MELNAVFVKTAQGDEAVQQRTRLVQRNLRTVLIVVDGRSTVAELAEKVGNQDMVLSALEQLERDGYVEIAVNAVPAEPVAATEPEPPALEAVPEPAVESVSPFAYPPEVVPVESAPVQPEIAPASAATPAAVEAPIDDDPFLTPGKPRKVEKVAEPVKEEKKPGKTLAGLFKRKEAVEKAPPAIADEAVSIAPIRRGPRPERSLYGAGAMALGAVVVIAVLAVFAFPYDIYRADIERALAASLGQTVKVSGVRASIVPTPSLILDRVEIGDGLLINSLRATPEIGSLFASEKRFSTVLIDGASVPADRLVMLVPAVGKLAQGGSFRVRSLVLSGVDLKLQDLEMKGCSGELPLAAGNDATLVLRNAAKTLTLEIKPNGDALALVVDARAWAPLEGSPLVWDALSAQGEIRGNALTLRKIDARMLDGVVQGQAVATWGGDGASVRAELGVEHASAKRVAAALGSGIGLDGDFNARLRFNGAGQGWQKVRENLRVDGDFGVRRGALLGVDFADALRRGARTPSRGGSTSFDQMNGTVAMDGVATRLSGVEIISGAMRATGSATYAKANQQISGGLDVQLRGGGVDVRMPVALSGTLKEPQIFGGRR